MSYGRQFTRLSLLWYAAQGRPYPSHGTNVIYQAWEVTTRYTTKPTFGVLLVKSGEWEGGSVPVWKNSAERVSAAFKGSSARAEGAHATPHMHIDCIGILPECRWLCVRSWDPGSVGNANSPRLLLFEFTFSCACMSLCGCWPQFTERTEQNAVPPFSLPHSEQHRYRKRAELSWINRPYHNFYYHEIERIVLKKRTRKQHHTWRCHEIKQTGLSTASKNSFLLHTYSIIKYSFLESN